MKNKIVEKINISEKYYLRRQDYKKETYIV